MKITKIMSLDVETNGLWGKPISIGFTIEEDGVVIRKEEKCYINENVEYNEWVLENVINPLKQNEEVEKLNSLEELLSWFANEYLQYKDTHTVVYHMGHIVESYLFRLLVENKLIGEWDAPYTPIDVADLLLVAGYSPDSVDNLVKLQLIESPKSSQTHQALYDAQVCGRAFWFLTK